MVAACLGLMAAAVMLTRHWAPEPVYEGRPLQAWVREALDGAHWEATTNARYVVCTQIKGRAVPAIVRELRKQQHSKLYYKLHRLQEHLPRKLRPLSEPDEPNGLMSAAAYTLCEMGEEGRPGFAELAGCVEGAPMSLFEHQQVMWDLIQAGPVAAGALPWLRRFAAGADSTLAMQSALAIYNTEGSTNALVSVMARHLAKPGGFEDISRELWWFRSDERLLQALLPLICPLAGDRSRSMRERDEIVAYLGEVVTSNTLPRKTLEALLEVQFDSGLGHEVHEALDKIGKTAANRAQNPGGLNTEQ